jgi:hypothetical protein
MKTVKMNLATIQGKLSRAEMKNIMAGSNGAPCSSGQNEYSCSGSLEGSGNINLGLICASTQGDALLAASSQLQHDGFTRYSISCTQV